MVLQMASQDAARLHQYKSLGVGVQNPFAAQGVRLQPRGY